MTTRADVLADEARRRIDEWWRREIEDLEQADQEEAAAKLRFQQLAYALEGFRYEKGPK